MKNRERIVGAEQLNKKFWVLGKYPPVVYHKHLTNILIFVIALVIFIKSNKIDIV